MISRGEHQITGADLITEFIDLVLTAQHIEDGKAIP